MDNVRKDFRKKARVTQSYIGKSLHINKSAVSKQEKEGTVPKSPKKASYHALLYQMSYNEFMSIPPKMQYEFLCDLESRYTLRKNEGILARMNLPVLRYENGEPESVIRKILPLVLNQKFKNQIFSNPDRFALLRKDAIHPSLALKFAIFSLCVAEKSNSQEENPVLLSKLCKKEFDTDYFLWTATEDFPSEHIYYGQTVLIKPQTSYFKGQLVLGADFENKFFLGRMVRDNSALKDANAPDKPDILLNNPHIILHGRVIMAYTSY